MKPKLTRASEERLRQGAEQMVDRIEQDGLAPTAALVKTAQDLSLPAGHVELLCRIYNIGAAETHRKQAQDLSEKLASFPLADAGLALEELYPAKVPSPAAVKEASALSGDYDRPPPLHPSRRNPFAEVDLQAAWRKLDKRAAPEPPPAYRPHSASDQALYRCQDLERACRESRSLALYEREKTAQALGRLCDYFQTSGAVRIDLVKEAARHHLGEEAFELLCRLGKVRPSLKSAAVQSRWSRVDVDSLRPEAKPLSLVKAAAQCAARALEAHASAQGHEQALLNESSALLNPHLSHSYGVLGPSLRKAAGIGDFIETALGSTMGMEIAKRLPGGRDVANQQEAVYKKLTDPDQEAELRNARLTATVSRLHSSDPILSGYPLEQITHVANGIGQISPRALESEELLRSLMRKHVQQGSMDPYEIDTLLKIEKGLKMRDSANTSGIYGEV